MIEEISRGACATLGELPDLVGEWVRAVDVLAGKPPRAIVPGSARVEPFPKYEGVWDGRFRTHPGMSFRWVEIAGDEPIYRRVTLTIKELAAAIVHVERDRDRIAKRPVRFPREGSAEVDGFPAYHVDDHPGFHVSWLETDAPPVVREVTPAEVTKKPETAVGTF